MADVYLRTISCGLGMDFGAFYNDGADRGEIEVFLSRSGHTTDWHFDFMENFTMQLKGM